MRRYGMRTRGEDYSLQDTQVLSTRVHEAGSKDTSWGTEVVGFNMRVAYHLIA